MTNVLDLKNDPPTSPVAESAPAVRESAVARASDADESVDADFFLGDAEVAELAWEAGDELTSREWRRHYMAMGALGVVAAGIAFWQASILVALVGAVGIGAWELSERFRMPFSVRLHGRGVTVNDHTYVHADLTSFDVHVIPEGRSHLNIRTNLRRMPRLRLPLGEHDPEAVRAHLARFVPEEEHAEPLYEWWLRG